MSRSSQPANPYAAGLFQQAVQFLRAGDLQRAQACAQQVLALQPRHPGSLELLAEVAFATGNPRLTVELLEQLPRSAQDASVLGNLGSALMVLGDLERSQKYLRRALVMSPQVGQLHYNLGNLLREKKDLPGAVECYRRAIRLEPRLAEARINLSNVLSDLSQNEEAETVVREAIELAPGRAEFHVNLGNVQRSQSKYAEAEASYRKALELNPSMIPPLLGLAGVCERTEREEEAERLFQQVLDADPRRGEAHLGLAELCRKKGKTEEAIRHYQDGLALNPNFADVWATLADLLEDQGRDAEAEPCYQRFLDSLPTSSDGWAARGKILIEHGQVREAVAAYRRSVELNPEYSLPATHLLFVQSYLPEVSRKQLFEDHLAWGRRYAERYSGWNRDGFLVERKPDRRLRVGYVSGDFSRHSVGYFIAPVLANHDHGNFEIYCYSVSEDEDDVTQRLRDYADHWFKAHDVPDEDLARRVHDDAIDILVDLSGHTGHSRPLTFARKPAPVQINWIGYNNTIGMRQMDYRITDALADPPGDSDQFHVERLLRLPECFCCYRPPVQTPEVAPLAYSRSGHITFGSFNNADKLNAAVVKLWSRILHAVPGSRLLIRGFRHRISVQQAAIASWFEAEGVAPDRLEFRRPEKDLGDHLRNYADVDIALDPFPYNGVTTTCEALWMGVPVINLAGDRHAARTGLTLLTNVGLGELVARTPEQYFDMAVSLAGDRSRLEGYRSTLRERMASSALMDSAKFTRGLEVLYRQVWTAWCEASGV